MFAGRGPSNRKVKSVPTKTAAKTPMKINTTVREDRLWTLGGSSMYPNRTSFPQNCNIGVHRLCGSDNRGRSSRLAPKSAGSSWVNSPEAGWSTPDSNRPERLQQM